MRTSWPQPVTALSGSLFSNTSCMNREIYGHFKMSADIPLGWIAQSVESLTQEPEVPGLIPGPHSHILSFSHSADSRNAIVSY